MKEPGRQRQTQMVDSSSSTMSPTVLIGRTSLEMLRWVEPLANDRTMLGMHLERRKRK